MEKKVRSRGFRIVLDIFILLIILASVAGIVARSLMGGETETGDSLKGARLQLEITGEYYAAVASLIGEDRQYTTVYFGESGDIVGYIYRCEPEEETPTEHAPTDAVNATVYVSMVDGFMKDGSFLVHGENYITPNEVHLFYTDTTQFTAKIISINQDG